MATLAQARKIALSLPGAEEGSSYGTRAFRVSKKLFMRELDDGRSIVVKIDLADREIWMESDPDSYCVTDHYLNYPMMIIRVKTAPLEELRELLTEAWRRCAGKRLLAEFEAKA